MKSILVKLADMMVLAREGESNTYSVSSIDSMRFFSQLDMSTGSLSAMVTVLLRYIFSQCIVTNLGAILLNYQIQQSFGGYMIKLFLY